MLLVLLVPRRRGAHLLHKEIHNSDEAKGEERQWGKENYNLQGDNVLDRLKDHVHRFIRSIRVLAIPDETRFTRASQSTGPIPLVEKEGESRARVDRDVKHQNGTALRLRRNPERARPLGALIKDKRRHCLNPAKRILISAPNSLFLVHCGDENVETDGRRDEDDACEKLQRDHRRVDAQYEQ